MTSFHTSACDSWHTLDQVVMFGWPTVGQGVSTLGTISIYPIALSVVCPLYYLFGRKKHVVQDTVGSVRNA